MQLTTRETKSLLQEYPEIEYLEAGYVGDWLVTRKDQLLTLANEERIGSSLAKSAGLGVAAVGFLFHATSPLAPIGLAAGLISYAWAQAKDSETTHTFNPIPFIRGGLLEVFGSLGNSSLRQDFLASYDEFDRLKGYLSPAERQEYLILHNHITPLAEVLSQAPEGKRFYLYRWLCSQFAPQGGSFPNPQVIQQHCNNLPLASALVNQDKVSELKQAALPPQPKPLFQDLPPGNSWELPAPSINYQEQDTALQVNAEPVKDTVEPLTDTHGAEIPFKADSNNKSSNLKSLPLKQRASATIDLLKESGFRIDEVLNGQIIVLCGSQRGGKGTMAGILSILLSAAEGTRIDYFTAGSDLYPFRCNKLVSALDYPDDDNPDFKVANNLLNYFKELDKTPTYSCNDRVIVLDELMTLTDLLSDADKLWLLRFLLVRAAKKGATIILVLHASTISSWVGSKNTDGLAQSFKNLNFIGCQSKSVSNGLLRKISVATGRYFKASPDNFGIPIAGGELGEIPAWLKTEHNPGNGHPDPVRTLLTLFPELYEEPKAKTVSVAKTAENIDAIAQLEIAYKAPLTEQQIKASSDAITIYKKIKQADLTEPFPPSKISGYKLLQDNSSEHIESLLNELIQAELIEKIEGKRGNQYRLL